MSSMLPSSLPFIIIAADFSLAIRTTAAAEIEDIIRHSGEPYAGDVLVNYNWLEGSVRLRTYTSFLAKIDYTLFQEYLLGVMGFARSHAGFWDWRMIFPAKVEREGRPTVWRKMGSAVMTREL